ncbi:hypothetical protein NMG60_11031207 [Bertholletia excelsa]
MTDQTNEESIPSDAPAAEEQQQETKSPSMAETEEQQPGPPPPEKASNVNLSFTIWPPSQRTRDAIVNRLIETLSSPSVLSKRYGSMSRDEAAEVARRIEEESFASASSSASTDDDGIEILQVYSKDISKRILEAVKSRSASTAAPEGGAGRSPPPAEDPAPSASEENPSVEANA